MLTQDWLTDAVLYVYALSLLFFASDAASGNRSARRVGTGLLVFVWIVQTAFLLYLLVQRFSVAELSPRDILFFVSWLFVSVSFVVNRWIRADLLVLLVNIVGFAVLALNLLQRPRRSEDLTSWETAERLLVVHVSLITVSFAILTVSAILGGMYLFLHWRLKQKRWTPAMSRMPSLELIERYAFRVALVGVPLLFLSLSTGTAALLLDGRARLLLDSKVLISFAAGCVYAVYMIRRTVAGDDGKSVARWNLVSYFLLFAAFFAYSFSSFHHWM